jgi:tetratricopeptide repeat protein
MTREKFVTLRRNVPETIALHQAGNRAVKRANAGTRRSRWGLGLGSVMTGLALLPAGAGAAELSTGLAKPTAAFAASGADSPFRVQLAQARSELQRQADEIFEQLLKDPKNTELTLRYAEAVAKLGNFEAAISSLERLLLLDRNYPGVRLELAQLYMRLSSYEMARAYLTQAEQEPGVTPEGRARIQRFRAEIDRAESGSRIAVNVITGLRYQTNQSAEPAGADIVAGGVPQTLSRVFAGKPGWDLFATASVLHSQELGGKSRWETNGLIYASQPLSHSWLSVRALEVNTGPRFDIRIGDTSLAAARPYVVGTEVLLGNRQYLGSPGGGVSFDRPIVEGLNAGAFYEFRAESFRNTPRVPAATVSNGTVNSFGGALLYRVIENGALGLQTSYAINDTDAKIGSNDSLVFRVSYTQTFLLPPDWGVGPLVLTPLLYRIYSWDTVANPVFDPVLKSSTKEWRYGMTAQLGLSDNIAANLHVIHEDTFGNVPNTRIRNTQGILGVLLAY